MPSTDTFDAQDAGYKGIRAAGIRFRTRSRWRPGVTGFWGKYVGLSGKVIGLDTFGESTGS